MAKKKKKARFLVGHWQQASKMVWGLGAFDKETVSFIRPRDCCQVMTKCQARRAMEQQNHKDAIMFELRPVN